MIIEVVDIESYELCQLLYMIIPNIEICCLTYQMHYLENITTLDSIYVILCTEPLMKDIFLVHTTQWAKIQLPSLSLIVMYEHDFGSILSLHAKSETLDFKKRRTTLVEGVLLLVSPFTSESFY